MPTPKSQTKVLVKNGKTEVTYESNLDASQYFIFELTRAALRDVGKYVLKVWRTAFYQNFKKHTGKAGKATMYKVFSSRNTKYPRVEIGLPRTAKGNEGFYAYFSEVGSSKVPKLALLTHAVEDNVEEILRIESQYLSALNDSESQIESLIDESEVEEYSE